MENVSMDKSKTKECHDQCAEYLNKAAELQKAAGKFCEAGEKDKAKSANFDTMGYLFAAMKHLKKAAKHSAGIECKCCKK
jgi:hypothetical protein